MTAAALAASAGCSAPFTDTAILDLALQMGNLPVDSLVSYIKACMKLKIPSLQLNVVKKEQLLEEQAHPGTHPNLIVRICGFSARFGSLPKNVQDEVISRLPKEG